MDDLISRQTTIDTLRKYKTEPNISDDESEIKGYNDGIDLAISVLSTLPSAQPEQKKGKQLNDKGLYKCSSCNELWVHWWAVVVEPVRMYKEMKYCPNCGAKMGEEQ